MTVVKVKPIAEVKIITANVNVVDVNVITRSRAIEEHVFKDGEPKKTKNATN